jgi:hypothetical protein
MGILYSTDLSTTGLTEGSNMNDLLFGNDLKSHFLLFLRAQKDKRRRFTLSFLRARSMHEEISHSFTLFTLILTSFSSFSSYNRVTHEYHHTRMTRKIQLYS